MITGYILIELVHTYTVSQNLHNSIFLYHCLLWIILSVQMIIYNQHFDDIVCLHYLVGFSHYL